MPTGARSPWQGSRSLRLTFLGTGAAEGFPALWCAASAARRPAPAGGATCARSAALINDDLPAGRGADLVAAAVRLGLDLAPVQALLVTHPHSDHLDPTVLMWRRKGFVTTPLPALQLYGSARTIERATRPEGRRRRRRACGSSLTPLAPSSASRSPPGARLSRTPASPTTPAGARDAPPALRGVDLGASHARPEDEACIFVVRQVEGPEVQPGGAGGGRARLALRHGHRPLPARDLGGPRPPGRGRAPAAGHGGGLEPWATARTGRGT